MSVIKTTVGDLRRLYRFVYNIWPVPLWFTLAILVLALVPRNLHLLHGFGDNLSVWLNQLFEQQHSPDGRTITNSGKPRWTYLLPAVAGAIGGIGALVTYIFNHRQREIQFDRSELEARFKDVQDRLASADTKTRANAALRLADMGIARGPGRPRTVTSHSRPFFLRSGAQLAISLYMEEDVQVRATCAESLRVLVDFAVDKPGEYLFNALVVKIADANRTARSSYIQALARYANSVPDVSATEHQLFLSVLSPFHKEQDLTLLEITDFMARPEFTSRKTAYGPQIIQSSEEEGVIYAEACRDVEDFASRLILTRDVLAHALRAKKRWSALDCNDVFLAGANLESARLQEINFRNAHLRGVKLARANFESAHLEGANLQRANLLSVNFQKAKCKDINLCYAMLHLANLRKGNFYNLLAKGADMGFTECQEANFRGGDFGGANLWYANIENADLRESNLENADILEVKLTNVKVGGSNLDKAKNVHESWPSADFSVYPGRDVALLTKLTEKHQTTVPQAVPDEHVTKISEVLEAQQEVSLQQT